MTNDPAESVKVKAPKKHKTADKNYSKYKEINIGYFVIGVVVLSLILIFVSHKSKMLYHNPEQKVEKKPPPIRNSDRKVRGYSVKY